MQELRNLCADAVANAANAGAAWWAQVGLELGTGVAPERRAQFADLMRTRLGGHHGQCSATSPSTTTCLRATGRHLRAASSRQRQSRAHLIAQRSRRLRAPYRA